MKKLYGFLLLLISCAAFAQQYGIDKIPSATPAEPISMDQAFRFSAAARDSQTIIARWKIKKGYYLYRARFHFRAIKPQGARLAQPLLPKGFIKSTPVGRYEVYKGLLNIPIPVITPQGKKLILEVNYQGCSEAGYCYPPSMKVVPINLGKHYMKFTKGIEVDIAAAPAKRKTAHNHTSSPLSKIQDLLEGGNLWGIIIGFLGFGILIAFTPCVLPMIPILSAIITGQKKMTTAHAFFLSLAYVLGMAITYAVAGMLVGLVGGSIQAALQIPWVIILFSLIFVAMALSLFGLYDIQLPQRWRSKLAKASEHQKRGAYIGVFIMGILSTLILSPCVTPPLVGILSYIGHTGNAKLGGLALFVMGIGMGLPLLVIGFSHGKFLPKSGLWMNAVKNFMGILMLALAIWMLQRIFSDALIMLLWAILAIGTSIYMGALSTVKTAKTIIAKAIGILIFIYGVLLVIGAATGNYNPLQPIQLAKHCMKPHHGLHFKNMHSVTDVEKAVAEAKKRGKLVMLDFSAQWCVSCKEMDDFTFSNPKVVKRLSTMVLLRADITANNTQDKMLMRHYNVIAPPTILFFKDGKELGNARIIGEMGPAAFLAHLNRITPKKKFSIVHE